jgi:hypothetical protein
MAALTVLSGYRKIASWPKTPFREICRQRQVFLTHFDGHR